MSFRTWDFHLQPWHLVVPMACVGAIDRDYVSIASGLGAVTGMQESKESLKGKKILSPLMVGGCWWVIQLHSQGRICVLLSTKPLNRFLPLRDGKLTELMLTLKRGGIWEPFASRKKIWTVSQYVRTSTKKLYLVSHGFHEDKLRVLPWSRRNHKLLLEILNLQQNSKRSPALDIRFKPLSPLCKYPGYFCACLCDIYI